MQQLRVCNCVTYFPPSPGNPAFYRLDVSFADFQETSHIHTYKTNTTTDGSDQNGSSKSGNDPDSRQPSWSSETVKVLNGGEEAQCHKFKEK
jgi:hypothetical protein